MTATDLIDAAGARAREASRVVAALDPAAKSALIEEMASRVDARREQILEANQSDRAMAAAEGISGSLLDRLGLTGARIDGIAAGLRTVAALPDPVGVVTKGWRMPNGVAVERIRVPLGVVAVIYEARPNVTADAAGLCVMAGNAVMLRGSSYALQSNLAIGEALRAALAARDLPVDAVQVLDDTTREGATALMRASKWIDLLVPRGGPGLIAAIEAEADVPYVIDGAGNCHVYVDAAADLGKAEAITLNAKVQRPGVCNAAETLLVHHSVASDFIPKVAAALRGEGVELRGDERARAIDGEMLAASEDDWAEEFLDLVMAVHVVGGVDEAVDHIRRYGTGHTEVIVTEDLEAAATFTRGVDAAVTGVNVSTRFTDGEVFGFGAEIGISTQKLHVRGPMGLEALTCERYVLTGSGQVR
jgi:glutamate-5-semialdehyde dehydrogenase